MAAARMQRVRGSVRRSCARARILRPPLAWLAHLTPHGVVGCIQRQRFRFAALSLHSHRRAARGGRELQVYRAQRAEEALQEGL